MSWRKGVREALSRLPSVRSVPAWEWILFATAVLSCVLALAFYVRGVSPHPTSDATSVGQARAGGGDSVVPSITPATTLTNPAMAALLVGIGALTLWGLIRVPQWQVRRLPSDTSPKDRFDLENEARRTVATIIGGIALLGSLYFTSAGLQQQQESASVDHRLARDSLQQQQENASKEREQARDQFNQQSQLTRDQLRQQNDVSDRQLQAQANEALQDRALTREGQITDRYIRSLEQLSSADDDKVGGRVGAIYALERIARASVLDHGPIMELLASFIRDRSGRPPSRLLTAQEGARRELSIPADVDAAIRVIGRREIANESSSPLRLDFSGVDLHGVNLQGARLEYSDLTGANLSGANLRNAHLCGARLLDANFGGAELDGADMRLTYLHAQWEMFFSPFSNPLENRPRVDLSGALIELRQQYAGRSLFLRTFPRSLVPAARLEGSAVRPPRTSDVALRSTGAG